jgi:hypothetical protein
LPSPVPSEPSPSGFPRTANPSGPGVFNPVRIAFWFQSLCAITCTTIKGPSTPGLAACNVRSGARPQAGRSFGRPVAAGDARNPLGVVGASGYPQWWPQRHWRGIGTGQAASCGAPASRPPQPHRTAHWWLPALTQTRWTGLPV